MIAALRKFLEIVVELRRRREIDPLKYWRPTPPQLEWLQLDHRFPLLRGPNQSGKTEVGAFVLLCRMLGHDPLAYLYEQLGIDPPPARRVHSPPIQAWVLCSSWNQSLRIQRKVSALLDARRLAKKSTFTRKNGFANASFEIDNGSLCTFLTGNQRLTDLASDTVHLVWADEPMPESRWSEILARLSHHRGPLIQTLTPIGAPVKWLQDKVQSGQIAEVHYELSVDNCTPLGGVPFKTQEAIDEDTATYAESEVDQRIRGAWEGTTPNRYFESFTEAVVVEGLSLPDYAVQIGIGIDHGMKPGSQVAHLVAVDASDPHWPRIWVLAEYVNTRPTTPDDDARAILAMLGRRRMSVHHVDSWRGDRRYGGQMEGGAKDNRLLMAALSDELGLDDPINLTFRIQTAYKPRGSVHYSGRVLDAAMRRQRFLIDKSCESFIATCRHWQRADDEYKHAFDSVRYGVMPLVDERYAGPGTVRID